MWRVMFLTTDHTEYTEAWRVHFCPQIAQITQIISGEAGTTKVTKYWRDFVGVRMVMIFWDVVGVSLMGDGLCKG